MNIAQQIAQIRREQSFFPEDRPPPVKRQQPPAIGSRWRHKRRGTIYTVLGFSTLQLSGDWDGAFAVTYQLVDAHTDALGNVTPGAKYTRPIGEFLDGRFKAVSK